MREVKIRRATTKDLPTIQKLNNNLFQYEMNRHLDNYVENWAFGNESKE